MINANYYAKWGEKDKSRVVFCPTEEDAMRANSKGWDVFWCPNIKNSSGSRTKQDVDTIKWLFADFDSIELPQLKRAINSLLDPTMVIKTRGGFHVYWELYPTPYDQKMDAQFKEFCDTRLIPLGADNQVKDVTRLLRPPMMRYWWDSKGKSYSDSEIHTELIYCSSHKYTWSEMLHWNPVLKKINTNAVSRAPQPREKDEDIWEAAKRVPITQALEALSGKGCVGYEKYTFKNDASGKRIIVNGEPSNAWIDKDGKIGSTVDAGPTIIQWLRYYGHDWADIAKIIKEDLLS